MAQVQVYNQEGRKTSKLVVPTNNFVTGKGHRSSQLYTHNPLWKINNLD